MEDGKYVPGWVLEPGDVRALILRDASGDAFCISHVFVMLECGATAGQFIYRLVNIVHGEVKDGIGCGNMIVFRVDNYFCSGGKMESEHAVFFGDFQAEDVSVKFLRFLYVVY